MALQHKEAGVPKTIPWSGPTVVVYARGKKGEPKERGQDCRKFYQWCMKCCKARCDNNAIGCSKIKCWIAPRKWRTHIESKIHILALGINHHPARQSMASSMDLSAQRLAPAVRTYASSLCSSAREAPVVENMGGGYLKHQQEPKVLRNYATAAIELQAQRRENLSLTATVNEPQITIMGRLHEGQSLPSQIVSVRGLLPDSEQILRAPGAPPFCAACPSSTGVGGLRDYASSALKLQAQRNGQGNRYKSSESSIEYTANLGLDRARVGSLDNSIRRAEDEPECLDAAIDSLRTAILGRTQHGGQSSTLAEQERPRLIARSRAADLVRTPTRSSTCISTKVMKHGLG